MRPVRVTPWVLALMLMPSGAGAQQPLSLEQAMALARARNPAVRSSQAAARQATDHVGEARAGWLPQVSYTEGWHRGDQPVFVFSSLLAQRRFGASDFAIDALNHPAPVDNFQSSVVVQQRVFDGGRLRAAVRSAELTRDIARDAVGQASNDVGLATARAYGAVLVAVSDRRAAAAAVRAAAEDLARAEHRRDVGVGPEADVLALQVHLAQMQERQIQSASDEAVTRARLNDVLGVPLATRYALSEPSLPAAPRTPLAVLEQEALARRPEVRQAASRVALAATARRAAEAAWWPDISVQGGYELDGARFDRRASSWTVGAELRWNLFGGGADLARLHAAAAGETGAEARREQVETSVRLDVLEAVKQLEAARARVAVGQAAVAQALESQRMIRDRYAAGLATVNDVLRAATAVLDARSQRIAAEVDAWTGNAALNHALGR